MDEWMDGWVDGWAAWVADRRSIDHSSVFFGHRPSHVEANTRQASVDPSIRRTTSPCIYFSKPPLPPPQKETRMHTVTQWIKATDLGRLVLVVPARAQRRAQLVLVLRQPCRIRERERYIDMNRGRRVRKRFDGKGSIRSYGVRPIPRLKIHQPPPTPPPPHTHTRPRTNTHPTPYLTPHPTHAPFTTVAAISRSEQK
jgi:hypothetical protein